MLGITIGFDQVLTAIERPCCWLTLLAILRFCSHPLRAFPPAVSPPLLSYAALDWEPLSLWNGIPPCHHGTYGGGDAKVWGHVYGRDNLNVAPEDHAVLLTEAPLNPYRNRRQCAETFFENFGVPAMFCAPQVRDS